MLITLVSLFTLGTLVTLVTLVMLDTLVTLFPLLTHITLDTLVFVFNNFGRLHHQDGEHLHRLRHLLLVALAGKVTQAPAAGCSGI